MLLSGIRYQFHSMSLKLGKMSEMQWQNYALCLLFSGLSTADLCSFVVSSKPPHAMGLKLKAVIKEPAQSEISVQSSDRYISTGKDISGYFLRLFHKWKWKVSLSRSSSKRAMTVIVITFPIWFLHRKTLSRRTPLYFVRAFSDISQQLNLKRQMRVRPFLVSTSLRSRPSFASP